MLNDLAALDALPFRDVFRAPKGRNCPPSFREWLNQAVYKLFRLDFESSPIDHSGISPLVFMRVSSDSRVATSARNPHFLPTWTPLFTHRFSAQQHGGVHPRGGCIAAWFSATHGPARRRQCTGIRRPGQSRTRRYGEGHGSADRAGLWPCARG